eukprot:SM000175S03326  [mRNA]  locus=s175:272050:274003:- [translate_table: standard]
MWNKRPEFGAWLAEVRKVDLETLPAPEEKALFKDFMEDYNTATMPSRKYYNIDTYEREKARKAAEKGTKNYKKAEMTEFNDEDARREEIRQLRAARQEEELQQLKRQMQSGMARWTPTQGEAMRKQALMREEMQYQYRLGNVEAAEKIQRRLDPDLDYKRIT